MGYRGPPEIRRHLWILLIKITGCQVLFRVVDQVLRIIKPAVLLCDRGKFIPGTFIVQDEIPDCFPVDAYRSGQGAVLFSDFHTVAGCNTHRAILISFSVF